MKTCVLILTVLAFVNAAVDDEYPEYEEDYGDKYPINSPFAKSAKSEANVPKKEPEYEKDFGDSPKLAESTKNKEVVPKKGVIYDLNNAKQLFEKFIKDYNKQYKDQADYQKHYEQFVESLKEINKVNSSGATFTEDINLFSDMGQAEFDAFGGPVGDFK